MDSGQNSIAEALKLAKQVLKNIKNKNIKNFDTATLDAEVLCSFVLNKPRVFLYTHPEFILTPEQINLFTQLITQRAEGMPIAYLTQSKEFWSLNFKTTPAVLIPRPETELLMELVLHRENQNKNKNFKLIDFGTGTGILAVTLKKLNPDWEVYATDISKEALSIAQENAYSLCRDTHNAIQFFEGDWASAFPDELSKKLEHNIDLIISNPPYLAPDDPHLLLGDLRFEPKHALVAEAEGLADFEKIIKAAKNYLKPEGEIYLEHGYQQGQAVRNLLNQHQLIKIKTYLDLNQHERVTVGTQS